ncbi:MAG TPA: DUF1232 domain-containing protein [Bacillota bacterium]|nr:DUF1232 domain-containing protein [Bacillota bacterium]
MALESWKEKTRELKAEIYALYLAYRDPRVPWYAKLLSAAIIGYALSPIDLIPDFIPVLGLLDDLLLLPIGIMIVVKMIPPEVLHEYREKAKAEPVTSEYRSWVAAIFILFVWITLFYLLIRGFLHIH